MSRFAAPAVLVLVTGIFLFYGRFAWSWLAGPVAALVVWTLDRYAREPAQPAPRRRDPAPVD
jgi:hypothetical protein